MEIDESESTRGGRKEWSQPTGIPSPSPDVNAKSVQPSYRWYSSPPTSQAKDKRLALVETNDGPDRPAFRPEHHVSTTSSRMKARAVVIPYSRLKKDRFFDWPPDPTVSRATPMPFREFEPPPAPEVPPPRVEGKSMARQDGDVLKMSETSNDRNLPRGMRNRRVQSPAKPAPVPRNLYM
jgi:hypothetical protein